MRILGVTEHWSKLEQGLWTTFRVPRKDRDWQIGETVQLVFKPRSKQRETLGIARIVRKNTTTMMWVTEDEAIADGFVNWLEMWIWLLKAHKGIKTTDTINKLTLKWIER